VKNGTQPLAGWLLLRDGHAVPITGLAPDDLKRARGETKEREGTPLKHVSGLNAIVHCLGFDGDFGDYQRSRWDRVQRLMAEHGLRERRDLFEVPEGELTFPLMKRQRRALADRIFFGPSPIPRRAFTGYGHDWQAWSRIFGQVSAGGWDDGDENFEPADIEKTREWIFAHMTELWGNLTFFSDHLLDLGQPGRFEAATYFTGDAGADERRVTIRRQRKVAETFRWFIDHREDGWIGIVPVTDDLVLLKGPDGAYDLLWRNLRETKPPSPEKAGNRFGLHPLDMPSSVQAGQDFTIWNYYRRDAWDEKERHEAEIHHYASGGLAGPNYPGQEAILERWLRTSGAYARKPGLPEGKVVPAGFTAVTLASGRSLLVSEMVTLSEYRRFTDETGYFERREGEDWSAANEGNPDSAPVGATLRDALAFCAWKERQLGVAVRLFTVDEHRELRPFASDHYRNLRLQDFPWENFPPRSGLEPSVAWSEPRFLEPRPGVPAFPDGSGVSLGSRKRWIDAENYPPRAMWREPLPWVEHSGIRFIDAWDAYEWCADGRIAGRYWEGPIGIASWGEYKNLKVGFRIVIDREVDPG